MRKKTRKHCVELAKKVALKRDGYTCLWCGRSKASGYQMHGSHIKGEGAYPNLSYHSRNIKCLCSYCHRKWHSSPLDSASWFRETFPKWAKEIDQLVKEPVGKPNYTEVYAELQAEFDALEEIW